MNTASKEEIDRAAHRKSMIESAEMCLKIEGHKEALERLWCQLHKEGKRIPSSEEVLKMAVNCRFDDVKEGDMNTALIYTAIHQGLHFLYQLALVKERM
jgi:hypothetical protein